MVLTLKDPKPFQRLRMAASSVRLIPHMLIMSGATRSEIIKADLVHWADRYGMKKPESRRDFAVIFVAFMTFTPEYRNVFYLRSGIIGRLFSFMCPPEATLDIVPGKIGPGLFIQHGISTLVSAESIGANCWINQHVVIGFANNETDRPIIGNNVRISAGAKILGGVTVGDNATIGPNTVVIADVAPGATVLGVPARVVSIGYDPGRSRPRLDGFTPAVVGVGQAQVMRRAGNAEQ
jgi:serine O-acetyltransferase